MPAPSPAAPDEVRFDCWNCHKPIRVARHAAGRRGRCPQCKAGQRVPGEPTPELLVEREQAKRAKRKVFAPRRRFRRPSARRGRRAGLGPLPWLAGGAGLVGAFVLVGMIL